MALPVYTADDLSTFTGIPVEGLPETTVEDISQASLLVSQRTSLWDVPGDANRALLLKYAVLDVAFRLGEERKYAKVKANPFSSETIGSYSYSKSTSAKEVLTGRPTGVMWLDLLLDALDGDLNTVAGGSAGGIHVFENDNRYTDLTTGEDHVLGPAEMYRNRYYFGRPD